MEKLNDDCLLELNEYLNDKDQIDFARAFYGFHNVMAPIWQKKYEYIDTDFFYDIKEAKLTDDEIRFLVSNICGTTIYIDLRLCSPKQIKLLSIFVFPKVKTLKTDYIDIIDDNDNIRPDDYIDLNKMFPNVDEFIISGHFSFENFQLPKKLEVLKVRECPDFNWRHFQEVLSEFPLKSLELKYLEQSETVKSVPKILSGTCHLENLFIEYKYLPWLLNIDFKYLPALKRLHILCLQVDHCRELMCKCLGQLTKKISEMPVEMHLLSDVLPLTTDLKLLENIEKLTITRFGKEVRHFFKKLPGLREFMFENCDTCEQNELFQTLLMCENLEFINITKCVFTIPQLTINVPELTKHRTKPLICNFYNNVHRSIEAYNCEGIEPLQYNFIGQSDLFQVTHEDVIDLEVDSNSLQFIYEREDWSFDIW